MRHRTLTAVAALLLLGGALVAAGCESTGGNGEASDIPAPDVVGKKFIEGKLELVAMHWPDAADREGRFTFRNVSQEDLRFLNAQVVFYFETPKEEVAKYGSEPAQQTFSVYRGEQIELKMTPKTEKEIKSIGVNVDRMKQVATGARSWDATGKIVPGTTFLDGQLECVGLRESLTAEPPSIQFTIRNLTNHEVRSLRYQVALLRRGEIVFESRWLPLPGGFEPGEDKVLDLELTDVAPGFAQAILLIKEQI